MRKAIESRRSFDERAYHDKVLSFGSPPMKYIRQLILGKQNGG